MGDENQTAAAGSAAPTPAPAPAKVDPRAAALAVFENAQTLKDGYKPDPKGVAAAGASGTTVAPQAPAPAAPAPAEAADQPNERLSGGFAKLAREKSDLLRRETEFKTRAAAFETWQANQDKIKADPAAVLEVYGLTIEQVAEAYLKAQAGVTEPTAEERLAALETEKAARLQAEEDARKATETKTTEERAKQIHEKGLAVVREALTADAFPTICALGEHEQAYAALSAYAKKHELRADQITVDLLKQVAAGVEKALEEDTAGLFEKVPHIAKRVTAPSTTNPSTGQQTASGAQGTSSTSLASSEVSGAPAPQQKKSYTREELRAAALAHFVTPN